MVPLAWLVGEATEQAARYTGAGVGGFLNASFGNAPEIIALVAVSEGLTDVVRASLTGSVIGNLLLVLGFVLLVARFKKLSVGASLGDEAHLLAQTTSPTNEGVRARVYFVLWRHGNVLAAVGVGGLNGVTSPDEATIWRRSRTVGSRPRGLRKSRWLPGRALLADPARSSFF